MKKSTKITKTSVIIKLESLFFSFIEDNFLSYGFYKYNFFFAMSLLFHMIFYKKYFQEKLLYALQYENLMDFIHLNHPLIDVIIQLKKNKKYCFLLLSHHNHNIVKFFADYLNLDETIGNDEYNHSIYKLLNDNLCLEAMKESIFITDSFDIFIIMKVKKIITCGSLIKILFNDYWNKTLINVYKPSSPIHRCLFEQLSWKKNYNIFWYLWLNVKIITLESMVILRLFFIKILFLMAIMLLIEYLYWPKEISNYWAMLSILETNNFINIINIIHVFKPYNSDYFKNHKFFQYNVLKSFGSLRVGLFIFSFISFAYWKNIFFLLIHGLIMGVFLKYPISIGGSYTGYNIFFGVFNILLYFLLVL